MQSWGARLAGIISALNLQDQKNFKKRLRNSRLYVVNKLSAITFESADAYSQSEKYLVRLRSLQEIEDVNKLVSNEDERKSGSVKLLLERWKHQIESHQDIISDDSAEILCKLLLARCRISRRSGHMQTAFNLLTEARQTDVQNESAAAINVLEKAIVNHYPEMAEEQQGIISPFERRKPFVEAHLLLADLKERCGASRQEDLIRVYQGLEECGEKSEVFCFHYAVFFDSYCESKKEVDEGEICYLLKLYRSVLEQGSKYLQNVMPRMLTVWLDSNQKCPSRALSSKQTGNHSGNQNIRIQVWKSLSASAQLITSIIILPFSTHLTYQPHGCHDIQNVEKHSRNFDCRLPPKKKATEIDLEQLIKHYNFLAASLIRVAEDSRTPTSLPFSKAFPQKQGKVFTEEYASFDSPPGSLPQLVLPFVDEVLEQQSHNESMLFSQIQVSRESVGVKPSYRFREVYITGVEESFEVLKSNANPKRIAFTASDGKKYPLLCKSNDELRKDSRFIDVEKMLNTLLVRDSDARRRSLFIRTFGVISLQEAGGIIEWVPNLITLAGAAIPLQKEILKQKKVQMVTSNELQRTLNERLSKEQRVKNFRELYPRYPLVMSEWLRRNFQDACSWYNAKQSFTRTAATMSMVGFVLGLGDRHSENILIDQKSGDIVHVDFNLLFDKAEFLRIPEVVPFRLTRNMIDAFGSIGVQGTFRKACEITMRVMRNEERMLVTVLQTFVHDPLLEWHQIETRNQQTKQLGGTNPPESLEASKSLDMIAMRLSGNIVTAKFHRPKHNKAAMSVEGQVAMLIEMATDEVELSRMYIGWNPLL
uniref:Serine/threonine-protein kinase ATR n=1 Tax=Ditylenchus dipsaci TaxID=166011 RepID=A0A915D2Z5_9BILA